MSEGDVFHGAIGLPSLDHGQSTYAYKWENKYCSRAVESLEHFLAEMG